jgi:hypothetical protein
LAAKKWPASCRMMSAMNPRNASRYDISSASQAAVDMNCISLLLG